VYYTHYFANHATLARARTWLSRLGFAPERIETHLDGIPRISVAVEPSRWSGLEMVINAVERSDPHGWPGYWDVAHQTHVYPAPLLGEGKMESLHGHSMAIGWHPNDPAYAGASDLDPSDYGASLRRHWS